MTYRSRDWVTLLGASALSAQDIDEILSIAPSLVAADGGAAPALAAGHIPERVFGDLDSLPGPLQRRIPADRIVHVAEQETTDFEKCLARIEAPLILALGFTGGRLDHELAVYNALVRHPGRPCIVIGSEDLAFAAPRRLTLDLAPGTRLSLFPMSPVTGRSTGLEWPIDGLDFAPDGRVGTSNRATGPVALEFDGPGMLAILPRGALGGCASALTSG